MLLRQEPALLPLFRLHQPLLAQNHGGAAESCQRLPCFVTVATIPFPPIVARCVSAAPTTGPFTFWHSSLHLTGDRGGASCPAGGRAQAQVHLAGYSMAHAWSQAFREREEWEGEEA